MRHNVTRALTRISPTSRSPFTNRLKPIIFFLISLQCVPDVDGLLESHPELGCRGRTQGHRVVAQFSSSQNAAAEGGARFRACDSMAYDASKDGLGLHRGVSLKV